MGTIVLAISGQRLDPLILSVLLAGLTLVIAIGCYLRAKRRSASRRRHRAFKVMEEREMRRADAVTKERSRIARELHDVAAHHLSGIVVQAGAAENLIDRDPDRAKAILRDLRSQGRSTLTSMRFLVGVLRAGDGADGGPQPGFGQIPSLVEEARRTGACVHLVLPLTSPNLAPAVELAAYRIVQESLSNARRHAPGASIRIRIDADEEHLHLDIRNGPSSGGPLLPEMDPGFGLAGMRERVELLDGDLEAGPRYDGGWRVCARLPRQERR